MCDHDWEITDGEYMMAAYCAKCGSSRARLKEPLRGPREQENNIEKQAAYVAVAIVAFLVLLAVRVFWP